MNKPVFYIILCLNLVFTCFAQQNLIYNGDFEKFIDCPQSESNPLQNPKEIEKCIGWKAPTYGTSDYFNVCSQNPVVSIPINFGGEQLPFNGSGYLGGYFTSYTGGSGTDGYAGIMWWEYIQGQTISPLEKGKLYTFSMEVSLAEYSDLMISEIGVYFSNAPTSSLNTANLNIEPQIKFYNPSYFSDTSNWIHLETTYIASGGEKYLTIGNFRDSISTDTLRRYNYEPLIINPYVTYMYVDNVILIESEISETITDVFTPNGDGINDVWSLPYGIDGKSVSIFNRWGNLIIEKNVNDFSWDGTTKEEQKCTEGVYFYKINGTNITGFIQLIR